MGHGNSIPIAFRSTPLREGRPDGGCGSRERSGFDPRPCHLLSLTTVNQPFYQYWARLSLGDIRRQRGNLDAALASYRDSLAIADRLAKSDPGNAGWQRDLSVSYEKVGNWPPSQP
jgi:hypothetical protein